MEATFNPNLSRGDFLQKMNLWELKRTRPGAYRLVNSMTKEQVKINDAIKTIYLQAKAENIASDKDARENLEYALEYFKAAIEKKVSIIGEEGKLEKSNNKFLRACESVFNSFNRDAALKEMKEMVERAENSKYQAELEAEIKQFEEIENKLDMDELSKDLTGAINKLASVTRTWIEENESSMGAPMTFLSINGINFQISYQKKESSPGIFSSPYPKTVYTASQVKLPNKYSNYKNSNLTDEQTKEINNMLTTFNENRKKELEKLGC